MSAKEMFDYIVAIACCMVALLMTLDSLEISNEKHVFILIFILLAILFFYRTEEVKNDRKR